MYRVLIMKGNTRVRNVHGTRCCGLEVEGIETWRIDITGITSTSDERTTKSYSTQPPRPLQIADAAGYTQDQVTRKPYKKETRPQPSGPGKTGRDNDYMV